MHSTRLGFLPLLALLAMVVGMVACGGGTAGLIEDDLSSVATFMGVTGGDFKAVRYNDAGHRDSALNRTLGLTTEARGDLTVVSISVEDVVEMYGANVDLLYDTARYSPESVEFAGLVDTPVEMAVTKVPGLVAAAQVDVNGMALRSGEFLTVTFRNEPARMVSQAGNPAYSDAIDTATYAPSALTVAGPMGWMVDDSGLSTGGDATYHVLAVFAKGDGNSDGMTNLSDLTPLVSHGNFNDPMISDTNFSPATADYNGDGLVTINDITPLGVHFNEFCTTVEIWLTDGNTFDDTGTPLATLDWTNDANALTLPAPQGTTSWDAIFRNWDGIVTQADITAADTGSDGSAWLWARAVNEDNNGTETAGVELSGVPPVSGDFVINDMLVQLVGATGGTGTGSDEFVNDDVAGVEANTALTLNVVGVLGTYTGVSFDFGEDIHTQLTDPAPSGDPWSTTEWMDLYDDALATMAAATTWTSTNVGDAAMRRTADVVVMSDPNMGNGVTGTVFPDDDPESTDATSEGTVLANVPEATANRPEGSGDVTVMVRVDVEADAEAPLIGEIDTDTEQGTDEFLVDPVNDSALFAYFDFGSGGAPGDLSTMACQLFDVSADPPAATYDFTWTDAPLESGEFTVGDNPDPGTWPGTHMLAALLPAGMALLDHEYALRLQDGVWNSVNKPDDYVGLGPPPVQVTFRTWPATLAHSNNDYLWVFYPEPKTRRNPRAFWNQIDDKPEPDDQEAFDDLIKGTGTEFFYEDHGLYPKVTIVEDADPTAIGPDDVGEDCPVVTKCPGYLTVDIGFLTWQGGPTDPDSNYGYRVFRSGGVLGGGTFDVNHMPMAALDPVGLQWGVNIFDTNPTNPSPDDRGVLDLTSADWSIHDLNMSLVGKKGQPNPMPPVLYIEVNGGEIGTWPIDDPLDWANSNNMRIRLSHTVEGSYDMPWDPRAITATGSVIICHGFEAVDFHDPGVPGSSPLDFTADAWSVNLTAAGDPVAVLDILAGDLMVLGDNPNTT